MSDPPDIVKLSNILRSESIKISSRLKWTAWIYKGVNQLINVLVLLVMGISATLAFIISQLANDDKYQETIMFLGIISGILTSVTVTLKTMAIMFGLHDNGIKFYTLYQNQNIITRKLLIIECQPLSPDEERRQLLDLLQQSDKNTMEAFATGWVQAPNDLHEV